MSEFVSTSASRGLFCLLFVFICFRSIQGNLVVREGGMMRRLARLVAPTTAQPVVLTIPHWKNIKTPVGKQAVRGSNKRAKTVRNPAPERKRVLPGFCVSAEAEKRARTAGCIVSHPGADKQPNSLTLACLWQSPLSRTHPLRKHKRYIFPDRLRRSSSARHIGAAFHPWQGAS